jgi:hypothetical protein
MRRDDASSCGFVIGGVVRGHADLERERTRNHAEGKHRRYCCMGVAACFSCDQSLHVDFRYSGRYFGTILASHTECVTPTLRRDKPVHIVKPFRTPRKVVRIDRWIHVRIEVQMPIQIA